MLHVVFGQVQTCWSKETQGSGVQERLYSLPDPARDRIHPDVSADLRRDEVELMRRLDQRQPDQLRPIKVTPDYLLTAEGSVVIEAGNTRVLCAASIEDTVPPFLRGSG